MANSIGGKFSEGRDNLRDRFEKGLARSFEKNKRQANDPPTSAPLPRQAAGGGVNSFDKELASQEKKQNSATSLPLPKAAGVRVRLSGKQKKKLGNYSNQNEDEEGDEEDINRELKRRKKEARDKLKKEAQEIVKRAIKKLGKKISARALSWGIAASIVGLIVTYLIWSIQAIGGNLLGSKWIPKLDWWEFILWGILGILLLAFCWLMVTMLIMLADPVKYGWEALKDALGL